MTVQSVDVATNTTSAYTFLVDGDHYIVAVGVTVSSNTGRGVSSSLAGSTVTNLGNINSAQNDGISFNAGSAELVNYGVIAAGNEGVYTASDGVMITNIGTILAEGAGIYFSSLADEFSVFNEGYIRGFDHAVQVMSKNDGGLIENSGTMISPQRTIRIDTGNGLTTDILNTGLIKGHGASLYASNGTVSLTNYGTMIGDVWLQAGLGNDRVVNAGKIDGMIRLGPGTDYFNGAAGTSGAIEGEAGNDTIIGTRKADMITGGPGLDRITGGAGADRFVYWYASESTPNAQRDVITDFRHAQRDRIDLRDMDADVTKANDQAFTFIGSQSFASYRAAHPGEIGLVRFAGGILSGNNDADMAADFQVRLAGVASFTAADLIA